MIFVNSPSNPAGQVADADELREVLAFAQEHDLWVIADEAYDEIVFDGTPRCSLAALGGEDRVVTVFSVSKTYAMTGWRLGFGIMPEALAERVELLLTHSIGCTASFTQVAGIEALHGPQDQVDAVVAEYQRRRDVLVAGLNTVPGWRCRSPQGAFYVFPNVSATGRSSAWWADFLLNEAGVATLPGTAFGKYGEGYLRLCFADSMENLREAVERIADAAARV